jgi:hypothetical protein
MTTSPIIPSEPVLHFINPVSVSQGDLRAMWSEPFVTAPPAKYQTI